MTAWAAVATSAVSGVFWSVAVDPLARLNDASDHHPTWVDLGVG
jgi:hypothetical protein